MANNKRKGDGLLGFGIALTVLGLALLQAPIGIPTLIAGVILLVLWGFTRAQDNRTREMQALINELKEQQNK